MIANNYEKGPDGIPHDGGPLLDGNFFLPVDLHTPWAGEGRLPAYVFEVDTQLNEFTPSITGYEFSIPSSQGFNSALARSLVIDKMVDPEGIEVIEGDNIHHKVSKESGIITSVGIVQQLYYDMDNSTFKVKFNSKSNGTRVDWSESISYADKTYGNVGVEIYSDESEEVDGLDKSYEKVRITFNGDGPQSKNEMQELIIRIQDHHLDLIEYYGKFPKSKIENIHIENATCDVPPRALEKNILSDFSTWENEITRLEEQNGQISGGDWEGRWGATCEQNGKMTIQIRVGKYIFFATKGRLGYDWEHFSLVKKNLDGLENILYYEKGKRAVFRHYSVGIVNAEALGMIIRSEIAAFKAVVQNAIFES